MDDKDLKLMDPISAGIQGVASVIGGLFSNNQAKKNRQFQREENQKTRDFNHAEAELARQYNTEMWNKTNEYNSPSAQINRLSAAGLNPDMIYGDMNALTSASMGSTSQQASSGHTATPVMADPSYFANIGKTIAETELLRSQSQKLKSETVNQDIQNKYADELAAGSVQLQNSNVQLNISGTNLNVANTKVAGKQLDMIDKTIQKFDAEIDNLRSSKQFTDEERHNLFLQNMMLTRTFQSRLMVQLYNEHILSAQARIAVPLACATLTAQILKNQLTRATTSREMYQARILEEEFNNHIGKWNALLKQNGVALSYNRNRGLLIDLNGRYIENRLYDASNAAYDSGSTELKDLDSNSSSGGLLDAFGRALQRATDSFLRNM